MSSHGRSTADDGVGLFLQRVGEGGRPLLVLNGFYLFEDFAGLADSRPVIGLDLRNRGRSDWLPDPAKLGRGVLQDVDDIEATRRHLGVESLDVLAHSYAGLVAVLYAMRHPSRVGRLVLLSPMQPDAEATYPEHPANHDDVFQDFLAAAGELQKRRHTRPPEESCREFWTLLRSLYVFDPAHADKLGHWEGCHLTTELNFMRYWSEFLLPSIHRLDFGEERVAGATAPVLVIHGTKDRSAPYGGAREWARRLPDARLLTVDDVAHAPWIEAPATVLGAIRTFLEGGWPEGAEAVGPDDE